MALNAQDVVKAFNIARCTISKDLLGALILRYGDRNGKIWLAKFLIAAVKLQAMLGNSNDYYRYCGMDSKRISIAEKMALLIEYFKP